MHKYEITLPVYMPHFRENWPEDAADELEVTVKYNYSPGSRGSYWEPPYGPEIDIISAKLADGSEAADDICDYIVCTDWHFERLVEHASER
jgi:hypothetical protein